MPSGFKNAEATFQRLMDQIFGDFVFVYLDDILISLGTEEENRAYLRKVFKRLQPAGLTVHLSKSQFFITELEFLGHTTEAHGIKLSQKHMTVIRNYQVPQIREDISHVLPPQFLLNLHSFSSSSAQVTDAPYVEVGPISMGQGA